MWTWSNRSLSSPNMATAIFGWITPLSTCMISINSFTQPILSELGKIWGELSHAWNNKGLQGRLLSTWVLIVWRRWWVRLEGMSLHWNWWGRCFRKCLKAGRYHHWSRRVNLVKIMMWRNVLCHWNCRILTNQFIFLDETPLNTNLSLYPNSKSSYL